MTTSKVLMAFCKFFELAAVFEVISRLQFDVLVQCLLNIGDNLLDVCVTHIDTDDDAPFGCIPIDFAVPLTRSMLATSPTGI